MLQPTDWAQPPDTLVGAMPQKRLELYRLIWDCALACTLKAPLLRHARATFTTLGGAVVAVASVEPASAFRGYWRFRTDMPRLPFPHGVPTPPVETLQIVDTSVTSPQAPTLGSVIASMDARGIGTPASVANMLKDMLEPQGNTARSRQSLLLLEPDARRERLHVHVTEHGRKQLAVWEGAGLLGRNTAITQAIEAVSSGDISVESGVEAVFNNDPANKTNARYWEQADGAGRYIKAICEQWAGLGREDGLLALAADRRRFSRKQRSGLPKWIDPEDALAPDHPLRLLKQVMEEALMQSHPAWESLVERDRADARLAWLLDYCSRDPDAAQVLQPHLFGPLASFSALRLWLIEVRGETSTISARSSHVLAPRAF